MEALIAAVAYKIHTDNGIQLTSPPRYADGPTATYMTHMFDMRCRENAIASQDPKRPNSDEYICKIWTEDPKRFKLNPIQQMPD